jgi:hypothetical protein
VVADYWDDFRDGYYARDPNDPRYNPSDPNWTDPNNNVLRDIDNPDWTVNLIVPDAPSLVQVVSDSVADKAVRMWADKHWLIPYGATGLGVDDGDYDPNTSMTYWDDTTDHYFLVWVYYTGYMPSGPNFPPYSFLDPRYDPNHDDPNDDRGEIYVMMHVDDANWTGYIFHNAFNTFTAWNELPRLWSITSFCFGGRNEMYRNFRELYTNTMDPGWASYPNVPWTCMHMKPDSVAYEGPNLGGQDIDVWERTGYWMLIQFERDPGSASGDPNGKYLRAAIWHGDKYDWDGKWILGGAMTGLWKDPMPQSPCDPNWYWPAGKMYLVVTSSDETDPQGRSEFNGFPAEAAVDNIEARTGKFSRTPRRLHLTVAHSNWGWIAIDPDLRDPTDPNTPDQKLLRYTDGTEIVLTATPVSGKSFKEWTIYDPNYPGDLSHAATDANAVLYLTMNADRQIDAVFKCGSGVGQALPLLIVGATVCGLAKRRMGRR